MKLPLKIWYVALLLLTVFVSGCGCGGEAPVGLSSIELSADNQTIALGTHQQFTATGIFSDGSKQDLTKTVTWSSSDAAIADISNDAAAKGLAVAHATGTVKITAASGSISGSATLIVRAADLVSLTITPETSSVAMGTHQQFKAVGTFTDNTTQDITQTVTWSSSNISVATISDAAGSKGLVTAAAVGSTNITAISGNISKSTSLTVTAATLAFITVTPANNSVQNYSKVQYSALGTFTDASTQDMTQTVTWSSSNTSVATISDKGLASAVAAGTSAISAILGGISGSTSLTVTSVALVSITISPKNAILGSNGSLQYTAMGTFSDNTKRDITADVTWSSSDTSMVSISNSPGSAGLATRNSNMFFFVTITAALGNISDSTKLIDP